MVSQLVVPPPVSKLDLTPFVGFQVHSRVCHSGFRFWVCGFLGIGCSAGFLFYSLVSSG